MDIFLGLDLSIIKGGIFFLLNRRLFMVTLSGVRFFLDQGLFLFLLLLLLFFLYSIGVVGPTREESVYIYYIF